MKSLTYSESDILKNYTAEKIKEISLEELQAEYLRDPTCDDNHRIKNDSKDNKQIKQPTTRI